MARTGRPRGFDRDAAVQSAMHLFWEQGYEATSLDQLKRAMGGLSPASFYAAFGSKEALFRETLARYLATHGQVTAPLRDPALAPRAALEQALRGSARMQTEADHPTGCMIALGATGGAQGTQHLQALIRAERAANRTAIRECIQRAVRDGDLLADTDVTPMATLFDAVLLGLSIQARDGENIAALDASITDALKVWDTYRRSAAPLA